VSGAEEKDLPQGWCWTELGEIGTWTSGGTPSRSHPEYFGGDIPWVKTGDLHDCPVDFIPESITNEAINNSAAKIYPPGTLLIAMYGATIGKMGILRNEAASNQACAALIPEGSTGDLVPFVFYYLFSERGKLRRIGQGGAQPNISQTILKAFSLPLPPLPEQHRIVDAIETQFTRLDAAVAALERVKANLKRYRASVLKAAVEGRLVATDAELAKKEGRDYEPASVLLEKILKERRKRWEESELEKMKTKGKVPKDDRWKKKYKEPVKPNTEGLPALPEGWCWATVEQVGMPDEQPVLTGPFGSNLGKADFVDTGTPVLTIGCLREQGITLEKAVFVQESKAEELSRYRLKFGDLLFSRMATVGRAGLIDHAIGSTGALFNYHIMRLRLHEPTLNPAYFISYVRGSETVTKYVRDVNHGMTRDGINTRQLLNLPVPLPPRDEQDRIVTEVERIVSVAHHSEEIAEQILVRTSRLRQSILKWAFEGKLVDQDPNDEPASVLLERIKAEREAMKPPRKKGRRKKKA